MQNCKAVRFKFPLPFLLIIKERKAAPVPICVAETGRVNKTAKCRRTPASEKAPDGVTHDTHYTMAEVLSKFNANELRRADHEVHDIAEGRYDGRIEKYQQGMSR